MQEPMWVNYHKHTSLSNVYTKDSPLVHKDYWDELKKRYGNQECIYTTVEHGWAGNYFKTYDDLEKYNKKNNTNIRFVFGAEAYWVKNRHEEDKSNCHIILLARNDNGRKAINKIISIANKDGYYYRPRIDIELLEMLPGEDVMITTACIAFWNKYEDIDEIVKYFADRFKYFYLEVQSHNTESQKELNKHIITMHNELNIPIISGVDSHVISENQMADRDDLLESAHISYEDEDGWYMDYPSYNTLFKRFQEQGILKNEEIKEAIENTNIIFQFDKIELDRSLKVPVIKSLRDKTQEERNKIFENILKNEWKEQKWDINKDKYEEYKKEINHDIKEIEACNMADYFILSYYVMKYGQEKYGGVLTPTGRGSAVSMYLNKLLRLTKVDKVNSSVLMYSERFLTKERVLESHTPPDIDNNVSSREPFIQAQKELIGDLGTYDLIALGTLKLKAAWKMYARANGISPETANEVSKQLNSYELAKKHAEENEVINIEDYVDSEYKELVKGCQKYLGIYDNIKGHPCSTVAYDGDVESDIGVVLCKSDATGNKVLTAVIESGTIDAFGYLKQDYLIVDSIGLTYDIYKEIGIEPYSVNQLLEKVKDNKKVWDIYANGFTQCVNQCEQPKSTAKVMKYKPQNIAELTQFIAGIRPGFQSMYHIFESRKHFEYGIKALDNLLQDEYCDSSFIIYQESLMKILEFAGFPMSETYNIVKAISKKKDYVIKEAKPKFIKNFQQAILDTKETENQEKANELAQEVWKIVENNASYSFNSAHAYCMAIDSVTIAYLKAYYPLEFYKVVLQRFTNKGEKNKVSLIKQEMIKRGFSLKEIKFGDDNRQFNIDKENNCIIQTMTSIKDMPKATPDALYELGLKGVKNRAEIYQYLISDNRINSKAIEILFKLNYFSKFGSPKKLMAEFEIYKKYIDSKVISKSKITEEEINIIKECSGKETDKQFRDIDNKKLISKMIKITPIEKTTIFDLIKWQIEFLGYTTLSDISISPTTWIITDIESSSFGTQKFSLYNIHYGATKQYRVDKKWSKNHNASVGDIITCVLQEKDRFRKSENGSFLKTGEKEIIIKCYKKEDL